MRIIIATIAAVLLAGCASHGPYPQPPEELLDLNNHPYAGRTGKPRYGRMVARSVDGALRYERTWSDRELVSGMGDEVAEYDGRLQVVQTFVYERLFGMPARYLCEVKLLDGPAAGETRWLVFGVTHQQVIWDAPAIP